MLESELHPAKPVRVIAHESPVLSKWAVLYVVFLDEPQPRNILSVFDCLQHLVGKAPDVPSALEVSFEIFARLSAVLHAAECLRILLGYRHFAAVLPRVPCRKRELYRHLTDVLRRCVLAL